MTPVLLVLLALVFVALVWAVAVYNRLVSLRQHVRESWADIDVQLKRRHDLIPNLVATVKGYAAHEREVLERVSALRAEAERGREAGLAARGTEEPLCLALGRLFAVAENYPALRADAHFLALQRELAETEDRIAAARRFFNANVRDFNTLCEQAPTNLVAGMGGFRPAAFFELSEAAERVVPRVG